jgi:hypothetical protein
VLPAQYIGVAVDTTVEDAFDAFDVLVFDVLEVDPTLD